MKKNIASLFVALSFFILSISGILLYLKQKSHPIEITHTILGLFFTIMASFHIYNNWKTWVGYTKDKNTGAIKKPFIYITLIVAVIVTLALTEVLEPVAEFGKIFASNKGKRPSQGVVFQEKTTNDSTSGKNVTLILQKNEAQMGAAFTIEVADSTGKIVETLFKVAKEQDGPPAPPSNLMLHTKITSVPPFEIVITSINKDQKTELKNKVVSLASGIQQLFVTDTAQLKRAILEIK